MARVPAHIARALDAEARAVLARARLPMWLGLYRFPVRDKRTKGEKIRVHREHRPAVLRGREPVLHGRLPLYAAIIPADSQIDASARYVLRLWMAWRRRQRAVLAEDAATDAAGKQAAIAARRAAEALFNALLKESPSRDRGARNIAAFDAKESAKRQREWARWQEAADAIWKRSPRLTRMAVARLIAIEFDAKVSTVRQRIAPPPK